MVVGHAGAISAGEWVTATGEWFNDRTHGQQFKTRFLETSAPAWIEGIERYLASGMIRGIGPVYAKKLPRAFGEKVFDVIEAEPDRLCEVDGIGHVRASRIVTAWADPLRCAQPRGGAFGDETEGVDQCPDVGKVC
jgi:exodeoxyribonuclease V alpha subunit